MTLVRAIAVQVVVIAALMAAAPEAASTPGLCFTSESVDRARNAMSPYLTRPYIHQEEAQVGEELRLFLVDCEVDSRRRIRCNLDRIPNEPHRLRDAASAFYAQIEVCPHEPTGSVRSVFTVGVDSEATPAPSPSTAP